MKKFIGSLLLILVAITVILYFTSSILLSAILSGVVGAPVHVQRVKLGLSGAGIYGLVIHNPKGFQEIILASVPEASVDYDTGAFLKGKVHLKRIKIAMDEVTVERNADGKFNLMEISAMKKPAEEPKKQAPSKPSTPGEPGKAVTLPPLQIDEVVLDLNKARFIVGGVTKEFSLGVQNETFRDVTYVPALIRQVVFFILKKVGLSSFPGNIGTLIQGVSGEASTALSGLMKKINNF